MWQLLPTLGPHPQGNTFLSYIQPVLGYRAAFAGRVGGGCTQQLKFHPLTTSCWVTSGHHLYSAELKPFALGLLLCCDEGEDTVTAVAANAYSIYLPVAILSISQVFTYLILMSALWSRCCFYRHFTNDKTEAQRDEITYKISHRSGTARIWTQTAWHQNVHSYLLLLLLHATPPWLLEIPVYSSVLTSVTLKTPVWLDLLHHKEQMSFSIVSCRYYSFLGGRGSRKRSSKAMSKKKNKKSAMLTHVVYQ